jgi:hypothetical protein
VVLLKAKEGGQIRHFGENCQDVCHRQAPHGGRH